MGKWRAQKVQSTLTMFCDQVSTMLIRSCTLEACLCVSTCLIPSGMIILKTLNDCVHVHAAHAGSATVDARVHARGQAGCY